VAATALVSLTLMYFVQKSVAARAGRWSEASLAIVVASLHHNDSDEHD
jgi:hypothetical protein